jgi:hypothetical protein
MIIIGEEWIGWLILGKHFNLKAEVCFETDA